MAFLFVGGPGTIELIVTEAAPVMESGPTADSPLFTDTPKDTPKSIGLRWINADARNEIVFQFDEAASKARWKRKTCCAHFGDD